MSCQELLGCIVVALGLLPACDPGCDVTTRVTVTDTSEAPIAGASVVETSCYPVDKPARTTDAAGVATYQFGTLGGVRDCSLTVDKPAYMPATHMYSFVCHPSNSVTNLVRVLLAAQ